MKKFNNTLYKHRQARPLIGTPSFTLKNESFELIHSINNLHIYRRTHSNSGKLIAYEVVVKESEKSTYPRDEAFGTSAWCFTGSDSLCKKRIEESFNFIHF